jgi:hypothetical protein
MKFIEMPLDALSADEIFVFLGPTLSSDRAAKILPARYLEPARCGDILAYLRLKPKVIALIDGVFDQNASVWHKEILWAMEQEVRVFGASSMGALRAAELAHFGMQGIGEIFTAYQTGVYTDDDEVAVIHGSAAQKFQCLSDAMVNIRATVAHAVQQQVIDPDLGAHLIHCAKRTFYPQRLLRQTIAEAAREGGNAAALDRFAAFVKNDGFIDQKQIDAIALLQSLANLVKDKLPLPPIRPITLNKSIFIRELQAHIAIRPLRSQYDWLPISEKVYQNARLLGDSYWQLRNLAGLLRWCCILSARLNLEPTPKDLTDVVEAEDFFELISITADIDRATFQEMTSIEHKELVYSLGKIQVLRRTVIGRYDLTQAAIRYEHLLQKFSSHKDLQLNVPEHITPQAIHPWTIQCDAEKKKLYRQVALLWALAAQLNDQQRLPPPSMINTLETTLLQKHGFADETAWQTWLHEYKTDDAAFTNPIGELIQLEGMVNQSRWWTWGSEGIDPNHCFLMEAIQISGFYPLLKAQINLSPLPQKISDFKGSELDSIFKDWCAGAVSSVHPNPAQIAFWLDFSDSEALMSALLAKAIQ